MSQPPSCLITGGTSGVGLATARRFASGGYAVMITGRNLDRLAAAERELRELATAPVITHALDVADARAVEAAVVQTHEQLGRVDVLVNNAGIAPNVLAAEMPDDQFRETIDTNICGVFHLVRAVWPLMKASGGGTIINVSSQAAVSPFPGFSVYGGTKAFVDLFTKAVSEEGKADGIGVFSVRPGAVDTPLLRSLFPDFPLEQAVTAADVANVFWLLAQPEMRFSTGEPISVKR
ncbi:MAG: SDR family oxidoreductase [Planctomycetota bacterium]